MPTFRSLQKSLPFVVFGVTLALLLALLATFSGTPREFSDRFSGSWVQKLFAAKKTADSETVRSETALLKEYQRLSAQKEFCFSSHLFYPFEALDQSFSLPPAEVRKDTTDLRTVLWRLKLEGLAESQCRLHGEDLKRLVAGSLTKPEEDTLAIAQYTTLEKRLIAQATLLETDLRNSTNTPLTRSLRLGPINGAALVLFDGSPIAYFPDRASTEKAVPITIPAQSTHTLSAVITSRGFASPGFSHNYFIGLYSKETPAHIPSAEERTSHDLFVITSFVFLAFILLVFALFQRENTMEPLALSNILLAFSLGRALQIEPVQASLDVEWIMGIRQLAILVQALSILAVGRRAWKALEQSSIVLSRSLFQKSHAMMHTSSGLIEVGFRAIYGTLVTVVLGLAIFQLVPIFQNIGPLTYVKQFNFLEPVLAMTAVLGLCFLVASAVLFTLMTRLREDSDVQELSAGAARALVSGLGFLIFVASYRAYLREWVVFENVATLRLLFQTQTLPIIVAMGILVLIARTLREQQFIERILPDSVKEIMKLGKNDLAAINLDQTAVEYNWIVLNDLCRSSQIKVSNLAIVTHILQSVFHKIHGAYFAGCIHFINSLGDAMLIAIKNPKKPAHHDPIVEKLVRCYALYRDGVQSLREAHETVVALLMLKNRELYLAIENQRRLNRERGTTDQPMGFRTILTSDYYFYGLNHELSNIDSRSIYIISKSEKLVDKAREGGFVVFPDLMKILNNCFPKVQSFFERALIDRERADPHLKSFLPGETFILDETKTQEFEAFLEGVYGKPLALRRAWDTQQDYSDIAQEVVDFLGLIAQKDLGNERWIRAVHSSMPALKNFREKNLVLQNLARSGTERMIWDDSKSYEKLMHLVDKIGVPSRSLIESVDRKDQLHEPEQILKDMASHDPRKRNRAVRFIKLARVQNAFRAGAITDQIFVTKAMLLYLETFDRFSVESHVYLDMYLQTKPSWIDWVLSDPRARVRTQALIHYMKKSPSPSLNELSHHYEAALKSFSSSTKIAA